MQPLRPILSVCILFSVTLTACVSAASQTPTSISIVSPTPVLTATDIPSNAAQTRHEIFSITGEQAQEITVFMNFLRAYNNGRLEEALALLGEHVIISDCDYQNVSVITFQEKSQAAEWLQQKISEHDQLQVSLIENQNPDASGRHVIGVSYARRSSTTLMQLGFDNGITPTLATKVIFSSDPTLIQTFANGPYGGDPNLCRPGK